MWGQGKHREVGCQVAGSPEHLLCRADEHVQRAMAGKYQRRATRLGGQGLGTTKEDLLVSIFINVEVSVPGTQGSWEGQGATPAGGEKACVHLSSQALFTCA